MEQSRIDRINELARIAKTRDLTPAEETERAELRREYIDAVKMSLTANLENTYIMDEKGNKRPLKNRRRR